MVWQKYTIKTTTEAEDAVVAMLMELGVEGVEINDGLPPTDADFEAMFIDPQPELMPEGSIMDGSAELSFYIRLAEKADEDNASQAVAEATQNKGVDDSYTIHDKLWTQDELDVLLENIDSGMQALSQYYNVGSAYIEVGTSDEDEWRDNWKTFYKPILIGRILAKPEWEEVPQEYAAAIAKGELKLVELNPGTAFGTGTHETTRLSVEALSRYVKKGDSVLDIGAGSGILGISAIKLGAKYVAATEIDPACEHIIRENLELNSVSPDSFTIHIGNILADEEMQEAVMAGSPDGYDVVVANILAPVIEELAAEGAADAFIKKGGIFITTGIIDTKEQEVAEAFGRNPAWELVETDRLDDWVSIIARRC